MLRASVFVFASSLVLSTGALAGPVEENPAKAPTGGVLLSDLAKLTAGAMMQHQHAPPPSPVAPAAPPSLWTLGGFAEVSYTWNLNQPANIITGAADGKENNFRIFDVNHNEFMLNHVQLAASKAATDESWVGFNVIVMAGQDAKWIHSAGLFDRPETVGDGIAPDGGGEDFDLIDAYMVVKIPESAFPLDTTIKIGKWQTHHGAEVISGPGNLNFSHSYLFGFSIPFTHTGVIADTTWVEREGEKELIGTGLGLVNGWDNVKDNNDSKSWMGMVRFTPCDAFETHAEAMFGPEQTGDNSNWRGLLDINATAHLAGAFEGLHVTGNYDYGWEDGAAPLNGGYAQWYGFAGYLKYDLIKIEALKRWHIGFRGEFFNDPDGARTGIFTGTSDGANFVELTTTLGYRPWESLLIRLEHRYDKCNRKVFEERGDPEDVQHTVAVDFIAMY